ncbi:MAG: recombinase RecA [Planctomycetes bacterium]|nr:recombinase RecA [Planctomycetota bacterium]MBI3844640.1 recombinase RecA [Planctomycetota bacterium]
MAVKSVSESKREDVVKKDEGRKDDGRKEQALGFALTQIEKQFGKGAIMRLGEDSRAAINGISTGALSLDLALGGRGVPRGRVVEIFGPESSGKTTLALHIVSNAQREGGIAAYIDAEHALDAAYARKLGVNLEDLLVSQPDTGEQALEICEVLVRSNAVDVIVIDSVAALVPRAEIEGEMGDPQVGAQARLMSQALRKLTAAIAKSRACVIFINQLREKIGVMFGNPETTPGGRALKYYSSIRIDIRRVTSIKNGEEVIGNHTRATVVKNKVAPPFRKSEFDILYNRGISREADLLDLGVTCGAIDKSGTWFTYKENRIGQGRDRSREFLEQNPDVAKDLEQEIRKMLNIAEVAAAAPRKGESEKKQETSS